MCSATQCASDTILLFLCNIDNIDAVIKSTYWIYLIVELFWSQNIKSNLNQVELQGTQGLSPPVYMESNLSRNYFIKGMKRIWPESPGLPSEAVAFHPLFIYSDERGMLQLTEQRHWCVPNSNENLIPGNMKLLESAIQQKQPDKQQRKKSEKRGKLNK